MATVWTTFRRESRDHPSLRMLMLVGVSGLTLGLGLIAAGLALVGQLVAGLAVAPLTFAVYLCRLVAGLRPGENGGDGPSGQDGDPDPPRPGNPGDGVDWERFEREYRAYADGRALVS